jgi:hypothetical protein
MKRLLIASAAALGLIAAPTVATAHARPHAAKVTKTSKTTKVAGAKVTKASAAKPRKA